MKARSSQIRKHVALTLFPVLLGSVVLGVAAFALHAGTPPQRAAVRAAVLLSRGGVQFGERQPGAQNTSSAAVVDDPSPLFTYTFGLIDFPRSTSSGAFGISDHGVIVGGYNDVNLLNFADDHAFKLSGNAFSSFDFPGAVQTTAYGINKSGQIVGVFVDSGGLSHGFELEHSTYTQLDCPGVNGTFPLAINSSGEIVGECGGSGFLLSGGVYTIITVPGALYTYAEGINKHGVIVGYYFYTNGGNSHGYVDNGGSFTTIDYPSYPNTYLAGINDSGLIVGAYGSPITVGSTTYPWTNGFLYSAGTFSNFAAPFGAVQVTNPYALNNNGEIVGGYVDSAGMTYGFYTKATP
jgi:uncharacterized membrane protein